MLPKISILIRAASAVMMIGALIFLTTANFWVYGYKHVKQAVATAAASDEEQGAGTSVPNPVEEKNSSSLQNLSEYLHVHPSTVIHPVSLPPFGNRHDIINLPIHHPELLTPPPKL